VRNRNLRPQAQAAQLLALSEQTVNKIVRIGFAEAQRCGRIPIEQVDRLIAEKSWYQALGAPNSVEPVAPNTSVTTARELDRGAIGETLVHRHSLAVLVTLVALPPRRQRFGW
jgi:hypothetical protein